MRLTSRDKIFLTLLQTYGCLSTKQIAAKVFPGIRLTTVLRRLRVLQKASYIQKILGLESSERLWALTKKSAQNFHFESAKTSFPRAILEHDLLLSTLRIRLEDSGIAHSWIPEHEIRQTVARRHGLSEAGHRVIPDGIMGAEVSDLMESIAIELELSPKNQHRYRQILMDYKSKKSLFAVWYLVGSKSIQRQITHAEKSIYSGAKSPKIFFSLADRVLQNPFDASIVSQPHSYRVRDFFTLKPAHPPAHEMSRKIETESIEPNTLSIENNDARQHPHK